MLFAPRLTAASTPSHRPRLLRAVALERFNLFAVFLYLPRPAVLAQARWGWIAQLGCTQACYAACSLILPPVRHMREALPPTVPSHQHTLASPVPTGGLCRAQIEAYDLQKDSDDDDDAEVDRVP